MTCDTTEALVAHMCDVVQFYMLPELKEDLDNVQLAPSQFESYHVLLANELPKFYDLVQEFLQKTNNAGHEELRYTKDDKMTTQMLAFSLSVGLNVRECYDFVYKQLGVQIFSIMLKHGALKDIQELNIHSVIYDHALRDAFSMDSIEAVTAIWNCLYLCLDHFIDLDAFTWNQCDDMLDALV
ncbi:uncharacterized protein LOC117187184 isoform X2 [Drosophila miranda]|uniref:uncharacterized protein LOC117187184 isoform X2 n=1 Tax=Drosophila miranda TaxID=7229 RepID=UPI00143F8D5E|nr:uncharacterized protein LOC117187184 isoform X2 [Drosophila miranda]